MSKVNKNSHGFFNVYKILFGLAHFLLWDALFIFSFILFLPFFTFYVVLPKQVHNNNAQPQFFLYFKYY